ncbi:hypothetical protein MYCTH_2306872 [Thermothelomyces thermophilus ATCC 42464]|uniref:Uncharacterized protein n=1 Tax=Thermothelomyces thermophilus (strain ATCC 42464 / BCRC 31852 / DSM 1799) TaxID=573729 RepID=G2QEY1_THET4|nr:uncharacterized protein MYCTH_2306872 [Thermothelomyces thermophilus ATCC 42464]AEO59010.1 hypothetical protein MYCTH_2306872 [Thermothelomyces thermophilus ATCC 42464]
MGKWNRGELAEGWYDPDIFQKAISYYAYESPPPPNSPPSRSRSPPDVAAEDDGRNTRQDSADSDDEDAYVPPPPPPPGQERSSSLSHHRHRPPASSSSSSSSAAAAAAAAASAAASSGTKPPGPSIPTQTDLSLRDEAIAAERESALAAHRLARRAQRKEEKALLDEALPRADAGTRERRLEKKRELNEKLRGFRDRSPGGAAEVGEGELMGGAGDAAEEYRAMVRQREERRRERLSRREEMDRARRAEREERLREYREREERVVAGLRELARQRFGVP